MRAVPGGRFGRVVRESAGGHGVRGVLAIFRIADGVHCVGVRGAFAAALVVVAWEGVVGCRAGFGGDGVEAAFEEFPVRTRESKVLC
jgi:hypothetical protein